MFIFIVLNTASIQIIPTTVIALRLMYNSNNPTEIIITSILDTLCSNISGLLYDYFKRRKGK